MTKTYPTEVLLSIVTGVLLCDFSKMQECCEFLCGEPVWTHQLAHEPFAEQLKAAVVAQHPVLLAVDASAVDGGNWRVFLDQQIRLLGASFDLIPMAAMMTEKSAAFVEPLRGKSVIGIQVD